MREVVIESLSFAYDTELVLKDINMRVSQGDFVCLLGQSGCGKSTFLRLLAGLEFPTSGTIEIDGVPVKKAGLDRGVVFQDYGLFPWMTAGNNIMLALKQKYPKSDKSGLKKLTIDILKEVGLEEAVFYKLPKELSGGMKQRCAIARAFIIDPPILLMDEPFGALDAVTRAKLQELVRNLWTKEKSGKTVFFVTHDVDEALLLASRIFVFGQSPSNLIFSCETPSGKNENSFDIYENEELMALRHELIKHINRDVASRITQ